MTMIKIKLNSDRWLDLHDLPNEIWVDIKNYENLYKISNYGRVKTLPRQRVRQGIMKCELNKGYPRLTLSKNGNKKHFSIHVLVAIAFIPNPNHLPEVNHKDENPSNCRVDNLDWCTHAYNLNYGNRIKKVIEKEGCLIGQYTLDGIFIKIYPSMHEAARDLKGHASAICMCCKGKQNHAYGYKWKYHNERR